jgi:hypothetical protein
MNSLQYSSSTRKAYAAVAGHPVMTGSPEAGSDLVVEILDDFAPGTPGMCFCISDYEI